MEIALIKDNTVVTLGHYRDLFPNTTFPSTGPSAEFMTANSALGVTVWKPHNKTTEKLVSCEPYIEDNQVFTVTVTDKTPDDLALDFEIASIEIRNTRNRLLAESDWTQVVDAPVIQKKWAVYRQELRDVTSQPTFPFEVVWPKPCM